MRKLFDNHFDSKLRFLVIRRNGFGDILTTLPLLSLIKTQYPEAIIELVIDERSKSLAPFLTIVDQIHVIPKTRYKYWDVIKIAWKLRRTYFDWAIFVKGSPMKIGNIFLFFIRARKKTAYTDFSWHSKLINNPVIYKQNRFHQAIKCVKLFDQNFEEIPKKFYPSIKTSKTYIFPKKTIFISLSNYRIGSQLDDEKYIRILNSLYLENSFHLVINAELKDEKRAKSLEGKFQMSHKVIITEKFEDLVGLLGSVDFFFIGDGGIMHLAAAMGKKQLILFGKTNIWEWGPLTDLAICLRHPKNVNDISEYEILEAMKKLVS